MANLSINIKAKNIGPHKELNFEAKVPSLQIALFAANGLGKTFISRGFRIFSKEKDKSLKVEDVNKALSLNSNGSFSFTTKDEDKQTTDTFSYSLTKGAMPTITNTCKYIFHVFNRDYVKENLEELRYKPNGDIEGYILGKTAIDLTKEKLKLEEILKEVRQIETGISDTVEKGKIELKLLEVSENTRELSLLKFSVIVNKDFHINESESFDELKKKYEKLKSIPTDIEDVKNFEFQLEEPSISKIIIFLNSKFNKSTIAESFKEKVKNKQEFIETGIKLHNHNKENCPFCEQELLDKSLRLIDDYNNYLKDEEARQTKIAKEFLSDLDNIFTYMEKVFGNLETTINNFNKLKTFLPSAEKLALSEPLAPETIKSDFESIKSLLNEKINNISLEFNEINYKKEFDNILAYIQTLQKTKELNQKIINEVNKKKNHINNEKLILKKRLCEAKAVEINTVHKKDIEQFLALQVQEIALGADIADKENQQRKDRKEEVTNTFTQYLESFFGQKYKFDKNSFCLKYNDTELIDNATDVLSDGEKSIVAFCYYLAETHKLVNKQDEYNNLFFIIDDPVSSMDFHYVYNVTQCIRKLDKYFSATRLRFLILTHHLEFISILGRNKISENNYVLSSDSKTTKLKKELVVPYEEHLRDIHEVSIGNKEPSHTTPNSIRHILETINRFKFPNLDLKGFCNTIDDFSKNQFLYSLINDNSHGIIRLEPPYTPDMIKNGCSFIVEYIRKDFEGQLTQVA
jgi:wobble nucleotide-excising tRNase